MNKNIAKVIIFRSVLKVMKGKHVHIRVKLENERMFSLELQLAIDLLNKEEAAELAKKLKNT